MMRINAMCILLSIMLLIGLCGCTITKESIIDDFKKNESCFNDVVQYITQYDVNGMDPVLESYDRVYASFAITDFKNHNNIIVFNGGDSYRHPTYYKEEQIKEEMIAVVNHILIDLKYAYICQVNAR